MSEDKSKTIIPKRATKTKLASSESVLKEGEIALIYPDTGPGTGAAKLVSGDGSTIAKNLPIAIDGEAIDELRESLDIAKKIIPITLSLTGWKSANDNNSAPYVQTVINEELKSSMNPDLVSMLDESATPEEQEAYNKNFAIISQGVGTVNNGSITYKVYKLPSADITIGLTRLGGVKEVETASGVDDVTVGGISVVKDKVAEIPAMPTKLDFVPYENAQKDIELGDKILSAGTSITEDGVTTGYTTSLYPQSISVGASIKKSGEFFPSDKKNVELKPDGMVFTGSTPNSSSITVTPEYSKDEDFDHLAFIVKNYSLQQGFAKLKVGEPTEDSQAATKKYVDDGLSKSGIVNYKDQIISSCIGNYINNSQQACVNTFPNGDKFAIINLAFKFSNSYTSGTEFEIMNFPTELIPSKNVVLQFYAGKSIGFAYLRAASKSIIATMPINVSASTEINLLGYYQIV